MHACTACVLLLFQCRPASNDAVIAAKESQIASLQAALMEKEKTLNMVSYIKLDLSPCECKFERAWGESLADACLCNIHLRLTSNMLYITHSTPGYFTPCRGIVARKFVLYMHVGVQCLQKRGIYGLCAECVCGGRCIGRTSAEQLPGRSRLHVSHSVVGT